ncbi:DUF1007 family protein [Cognatishimia sp. F0-27]|uniref:DUF1007 family protein n=1 Tax=Cognatishimia sp. F0-27 TaxID=2816855 RepID=UPI001D0C6B7F|nr:DUF1007 family protein [Cognatishimia sp. F0-27]MCC1493221.1 DUF1007 family protein [Cognatishimia sp. F0-27]
MKARFGVVLCAATLATSPVAVAHPHVFVDTTLAVVVEDGRAVRVDVTWRWDDFFSLLIFADKGLDPDGDAVLTQAELDQLQGFDFEVWPEGFEGDLYAYAAGDVKIPLEYPVIGEISVEEGRIVSRHSRALDAPADGLELLQYDPTYYVAYSVVPRVDVSDGCEAEVVPHDAEAAAEIVEEELNTMPEDMFEIMQVGRHFADRVRISCAASS